MGVVHRRLNVALFIQVAWNIVEMGNTRRHLCGELVIEFPGDDQLSEVGQAIGVVDEVVCRPSVDNHVAKCSYTDRHFVISRLLPNGVLDIAVDLHRVAVGSNTDLKILDGYIRDSEADGRSLDRKSVV